MQPIRIGDESRAATRALAAHFDQAAAAWEPLLGRARIEALRGDLAMLERLDRQYGGHAPLPLEDAGELAGRVLAGLGRLEGDLADSPAREDLADLVLGVVLWALRHEVEIAVLEPVVNALAHRSNRARSRAELAAVFGLMQGVIAHLSPRLSADLERSNPDRPWRALHLNLAITAIRTEDPGMMGFAFDALEGALPDERAGFFAEALALALAPGIGDEVRDLIEQRHLKWTGGP